MKLYWEIKEHLRFIFFFRRYCILLFLMIVMCIALVIRNNVVSIVIGICLCMNALIIFYSFIDRMLAKVGLENFHMINYTVSGKITLLEQRLHRKWRLLLCWLDLHLWQPQSVWEVLCLRNEIFNMYVIVGILVGVIITLICILGSYMRQVKDICRQNCVFWREHESNMLITKEIKLGNIERVDRSSERDD